MDILQLGAGAAAGGFGARAIPQAIAGAYNTGWTGYALNAITTLGLGWAARKFVGERAALGVIAGGFSATFMRVWQEKVSMSSPSALSGMGDYDFSSTGLGQYGSFPATQGAGGPYTLAAQASAVATSKSATGTTSPVIRMPKRGRYAG